MNFHSAVVQGEAEDPFICDITGALISMAKDGRYHFDDGRGPDDPSAVCMSVTAYRVFDTLRKEHPETWEAGYGDKTLWRFIPPVGVSSPYFSSDRAAKYGWGLPRLALVCLIAFELAPRASIAVSSPSQAAALGFLPYLRSGRWIGHLYIGSIGAAVNVQIRSVAFNLCMLGGAAALILYDMRLDYAILIYMLKTFSGDFIAGKLDTFEWRLVLLFTGIVAVAAWHLEAANAPLAFQPYTRILPALATVQLICELGDAHLENWSFFRHRYSFEMLSLLVLFGLHLTPEEFLPIQHDLVICLGYGASNLAIILGRSGADAGLTAFRVPFARLAERHAHPGVLEDHGFLDTTGSRHTTQPAPKTPQVGPQIMTFRMPSSRKSLTWRSAFFIPRLCGTFLRSVA